MKVAVTGATGFIGRYVIAELIKQNLDIIAISSRCDVNHFPILDNVKEVFLDINQPTNEIYDILHKPDVLIHLAWSGLPNYQSLHHFEETLPAHYKFISLMVQQGLKNLITTGTCFEYGMQEGPLCSNLETKPKNPYGFAKDTLRKQIEYLKSKYSFNFTWARLFYIYGEGQNENSLFPALQKAVSLKQEFFDMSHGEQLRDYLPVEEVAKRLVDIALSCKDLGVINLCSGNPISVRRLVENWINKQGWNIKLNLGKFPYPSYEPMSFWGVNSEIK